VAVLPFQCLAQDRVAGYRVGNVFFSELLRAGFADVVEPGQFSAAMNKVRGVTPPENAWSNEDLVRLGEETGVQGFFMGTVREHEMKTTGRDAFPLLSLEVRFVDAASGRLVWSASTTARGGPKFPVVGWLLGLVGKGEIHSMSELSTKVCRDLLGRLPRD
jgi:hypothetical protein